MNPHTENDNVLYSNHLSGAAEGQVAKNCLNSVQEVKNIDIDNDENNQVVEAILAINNLPLTSNEKADMIRNLLYC